MTRNAKWFGLSGEFFVDSILLRFGIYTSQLPEVLPADRIVYHPRADLRMQIKTCCRARDGYFHFNLSRGYHRSPTGVKPYETNDFDLVALVALSENAVKFSADRQGSQRIAISEIETLRADPCASLEQAIDDLGFAGGKAPGSSLSPTLGGGGCR
ncbi:hypothetical protein RTM1035_09698 [Roseovarius sp. TM1035]|nr:hypothetical protein RTM1035_09698 [Roseovarius sp. TM1035]